ncbi:MAG: 2-amino-4-hydroxy-6-hydroxymethyldihydropteridine diphosphokinase [Planctomycetota bacterium]
MTAEAQRAFVAVGSNLAPRRNIPDALERLRRRATVTRSSTFYRTEPVGPPDQPEFVNGVWELSGAGAPRDLKRQLRAVEAACGRVRTAERYAPRPIDLDLVLFGDRVADEPDLKLPHPDLWRAFVGACVLELAPDLRVPGAGRALRDMLAERHGRGVAELTPRRVDEPVGAAVRRMLSG